MNNVTNVQLLLCGFYRDTKVSNGDIYNDIYQLLIKMINMDTKNEMQFLLTQKQYEKWKSHENSFIDSISTFHIKTTVKSTNKMPKGAIKPSRCPRSNYYTARRDVYIIRVQHSHLKCLIIHINSRVLNKHKLTNSKIKAKLFELCRIQFTKQDIYAFMIKNKFIINHDNQNNLLLFYNKIMDDAQKEFTVYKVDTWNKYESNQWDKQSKLEDSAVTFTVFINQCQSICFKYKYGNATNKKDLTTEINFSDIKSISGEMKLFNHHYSDYDPYTLEIEYRKSHRFFIYIIDKYNKMIQLIFTNQINEGKTRLAYFQLFHQRVKNIH
eukprot:349112_1